MFCRNTVVLITLSMVRPAFSRMAFTLVRDWRVWAVMPSGMAPVAGSTGIWPEVISSAPQSIAWE